MKGFKNYIPIALLIASLGLGFNTGCEKKQDFIKVKKVRYDFTGVALEKNAIIAGVGDILTLKADLEGYDKDGIKEVYCYVNEEYYNKTNILEWITEGKEENIKPGSIKKLDREIEIRPTFLERNVIVTKDNHPEFKKGKHTLKMILEDYKGNKVEDSYVFEVKGPHGTCESPYD